MRLFSRCCALLLAAVLVFSLLPGSVLAAEGEEASPEDFSELLPPRDGDGMTLLDREELDALVAPIMEKYSSTPENFGLAFQYTGTGETYFVHPDSAFYGASLYKVPLCMIFSERIGQGEFDWEDYPHGATFDKLIELSLVNSSNDAAGTLLLRPEIYSNPYALNAYSGLSTEELPTYFGDFHFTPRFMLNTLDTLYWESERFPRILDYMKKAQPDHYFHSILGDRYEIAQKYGQFDGVLHTAGVIYTPTPIILVVMCNRMDHQLEAIGEYAELFADYALTLDQRAEEQQWLAEEEAKRVAEEARLAAEEAERAEAERLAAEKAAEEARMEAEKATAAEKASVPASGSEAVHIPLPYALAAGGVLILTLLLFIGRKRRRR